MSQDNTKNAHAIDLAVLNSYLAKACPSVGHVESADKFAGGQSNPTFKLTTSTSGQTVKICPCGRPGIPGY